MTQQRSTDEIRADVKYLNDHEAQTGRRSSAHVLLTHDVEPLLARVSELEQENANLRADRIRVNDRFARTRNANGVLKREALDATARADAAEAQLRAVEARSPREPQHDERCERRHPDYFCACPQRAALAAGLSLQEEQE